MEDDCKVVTSPFIRSWFEKKYTEDLKNIDALERGLTNDFYNAIIPLLNNRTAMRSDDGNDFIIFPNCKGQVLSALITYDVVNDKIIEKKIIPPFNAEDHVECLHELEINTNHDRKLSNDEARMFNQATPVERYKWKFMQVV